MRGNGQLLSARGLTPHGHVGWAYRTPLEFRRRAAEYLADGLALGQRVEVVAAGPVRAVEDLISSLPGGRAALDEGAAAAFSLDDAPTWRGGVPSDPRAALRDRERRWRAWTEDGYRGVRVIVDATDLARTPADRDALATFEALSDGRLAAGSGGALCAYDASVLGDRAGELTCLHPFTDTRSAPFRLFSDGDGGLAMAGDVDFHGLPLFEVALRRVLAVHDGDELRVDLSGVDFLGHRALLALEHGARASRRTIVLRHAKGVVSRIVGLIDTPALRVED